MFMTHFDLLPILEKKLENKHIISIDTDPKAEQFGKSEICGQICIAFTYRRNTQNRRCNKSNMKSLVTISYLFF